MQKSIFYIHLRRIAQSKSPHIVCFAPFLCVFSLKRRIFSGFLFFVQCNHIVGAIHESPAAPLVANSQNLQHIAIAIRRLYRTHGVYRAVFTRHIASRSPIVFRGTSGGRPLQDGRFVNRPYRFAPFLHRRDRRPRRSAVSPFNLREGRPLPYGWKTLQHYNPAAENCFVGEEGRRVRAIAYFHTLRSCLPHLPKYTEIFQRRNFQGRLPPKIVS